MRLIDYYAQMTPMGMGQPQGMPPAQQFFQGNYTTGVNSQPTPEQVGQQINAYNEKMKQEQGVPNQDALGSLGMLMQGWNMLGQNQEDEQQPGWLNYHNPFRGALGL